MKLYTNEAKLVEAAVSNGALDQDLKALKLAIERRMRKTYTFAPEDRKLFIAGSKWKFREDIQLRYSPQYLRGAVVEALEPEPIPQWALTNSYFFQRQSLRIIEFKFKPRGGFGAPPKYELGSLIPWFYPVELIPYDSEREKAKVEIEINKIREKHALI